ncbi:unnamed protein product [Mytilus edulis]|uniref:DDE-1 domain-containing protein n=1 Tax=Mytilus edulis TaxID=6550 RepID=A0A8S3S5H8_MYTED|nr:unnamed protein product [Mytilus edulis]
MAKYAIENGVQNTARKFTTDLGSPVNESTIRSIKSSYMRRGLHKQFENAAELPKKDRGRPLLLGKYDAELLDYIKSIREFGGIVNNQIVISSAKGILKYHDSELLETLDLTKTWAESVLHRLGYTKRKGTKAARSQPEDFEKTKQDYIDRIEKCVEENNIPDDLIFNWDQTGVNLIPGGDWTMDAKGSKQVNIVGINDKRQITALLTISKSGVLLPPQIIYAGTTEQCHPKYGFPKSWNIYHSENHWSNTDTMLHYIEHLLVPYVTDKRDELDLPLKQPALAIFDVFSAHRHASVLDALHRANIKVVYVPAGCTDQLQPLDLRVNKVYKDILRAKFQDWYADEVAKFLKKKRKLDKFEIDMRLSVIKPLHARWLVKTQKQLETKNDLIRSAFEAAGITVNQ